MPFETIEFGRSDTGYYGLMTLQGGYVGWDVRVDLYRTTPSLEELNTEWNRTRWYGVWQRQLGSVETHLSLQQRPEIPDLLEVQWYAANDEPAGHRIVSLTDRLNTFLLECQKAMIHEDRKEEVLPGHIVHEIWRLTPAMEEHLRELVPEAMNS